MPDATPIENYQQAVEGLHECRATYRETVRVVEVFEGKVAWEGDVHVFDLEGHETAKVAYSWSFPTKGSKRRFVAVLQQGKVTGPSEAVRAAIIEGAT